MTKMKSKREKSEINNNKKQTKHKARDQHRKREK